MALCSEGGYISGNQLERGSGRWAFDLFIVAPPDPEVTAFNATFGNVVKPAWSGSSGLVA